MTCVEPHGLIASFGGRDSTREKAADMIDCALGSGRLSSDEAAKLRGLCTWLDSSLSGCALRGALYASTARQYWDQNRARPYSGGVPSIPKSSHNGCARQELSSFAVRPEAISVIHRRFCEWASGPYWALWVTDDESYCTVLDPSADVVAPWKCCADSEVVITPAERFAPIVAFQTFADHLRGREVIWRVENQAAGTCVVKAGPQVPALSLLPLRATSLMAALGCRVWAEYIPSPDNIADPLSRKGLDDPFVADKIATGVWTPVPPSADAGTVAGLEFGVLWERFAYIA